MFDPFLMYQSLLYEFAFEFWRLLATEEAEVGSSTALANDNVPLLLSNAAWFPKVDDLQEVAAWYVEKGIVPALILPTVRDEAFSRALKESEFTLEHAFTFRALEEPLQHDDLLIEQVSWAQGRILGEHLAAHYGFPTYGTQLGAAITAAMQRSPDIVSFAAYKGDEVAGAWVAFEQGGSLSAMIMSGMGSGALETRLHQEAVSRDLRAFVFEPLSEEVTVKGEAGLERWSVR